MQYRGLFKALLTGFFGKGGADGGKNKLPPSCPAQAPPPPKPRTINFSWDFKGVAARQRPGGKP